MQVCEIFDLEHHASHRAQDKRGESRRFLGDAASPAIVPEESMRDQDERDPCSSSAAHLSEIAINNDSGLSLAEDSMMPSCRSLTILYPMNSPV